MSTDTKKSPQKKYLIWGIVCAISLLLILIVSNIEALQAGLSGVLLIFRPVILGLVLAYLCNPIFRFYERRVFIKMRPPALRRAISLLLAYLTILAIVLAILWLIIPQLLESILSFVGNYKEYLANAIATVNGGIEKLNGLIGGAVGNSNLIGEVSEETLGDLFDKFFSADMIAYFEQLRQPLSDALSLVTDSLFAIFVSIYLLASKEKRYAQVMKLRHALFSNSTNETITRFCTVADRSFGAFLEGKIFDSLIVGVLLWVLLALFHIPYAILLAAIIAIANIIPLIGPFIGAIPSTVILLLTDSKMVLPFLIAVIIVQQIDCNIITPKILGNNTGVSSLCVLIAIVTMGTLWGITGMLLGVPLFATVLMLSERAIETRLQRKGIPSGLENYYDPNAIVDPSRYAHATGDHFIERFERRALRTQKKVLEGEKLSSKERWRLRVYHRLKKHRIITGMSEEDQIRFAAEEVIRDADREARELFSACTESAPSPAEEES